MVKQLFLYKNFSYNENQHSIIDVEQLKDYNLEDKLYDKILVKESKLYDSLNGQQAFYFLKGRLKRIVFMLKNEKDVISNLLDLLAQQDLKAVLGFEGKNFTTLINKTAKNLKIYDFIADKLSYKQWKSAINNKAVGLLFFKDAYTLNLASNYKQFYTDSSEDSIAVYVNIDSALNLIYVGFCAPKLEVIESL